MTHTPHTLLLPVPALFSLPADSHLPAALWHLSFVHPDTLCFITNHEQKLLKEVSEILRLYVTPNARSGIKATWSAYRSVCNSCSSSCEKELFKREIRLGWAIRDFFPPDQQTSSTRISLELAMPDWRSRLQVFHQNHQSKIAHIHFFCASPRVFFLFFFLPFKATLHLPADPLPYHSG